MPGKPRDHCCKLACGPAAEGDPHGQVVRERRDRLHGPGTLQAGLGYRFVVMTDETLGMLGIDDLRGQVDTVIVAATDSQGRLFGRRLPVERFSAATRLTACSVNLAWDITQSPPLDAPVAGPHTGWHDVALAPDLATLRRAAWLPRTAICLADIVETLSGDVLEVCPRGLLARQIAALAGRGYEALAATEPSSTSTGAATTTCARPTIAGSRRPR